MRDLRSQVQEAASGMPEQVWNGEDGGEMSKHTIKQIDTALKFWNSLPQDTTVNGQAHFMVLHWAAEQYLKNKKRRKK